MQIPSTAVNVIPNGVNVDFFKPLDINYCKMKLNLNGFARIWFLALVISLTHSSGILADKKTDKLLTLVLAELSPAEGRQDDVIKWLAKVLPETRAYDGCKSLSVYQEMDSNKIILVEHM